MVLPRFELAEPTTIGDACRILQFDAEAVIVAGGTDSLVGAKKNSSAELGVSLARIDELKGMSFPDQETLMLGSMLTIAELAESPLIRANFPALSKAAGTVGSRQIRNRATIGGNIFSARLVSDTIGPLIAYGAAAHIAGPDGTRTALVESIAGGPGRAGIGRDEILTSIALKRPADGAGGSYCKYTVPGGVGVTLASVAAVIWMEYGACSSGRIVLGAVAPSFVRCPAAERYLVGRHISEDVAEMASQLEAEACSPATRSCGLACYQRRLVQILVRRGLVEAAASQEADCRGV